MVVESDRRLSLAQARQNVRQIDSQIGKIQTEARLFQRYGFGSDVHDIQLTALRAQRRELLTEIDGLSRRVGRSGAQRSGMMGWLMLPPALGAMLMQAFRPRRRRA